jgi:hypothetical protein
MNYATCRGCFRARQKCETRDALRSKILGLGVTSIKWKCADRQNRFEVGDPIWAYTADWHFNSGEEGSPTMDHFPGVVIHLCADGKILVFIEKGALGRETEAEFYPLGGRGFCKIPISRLSNREGERETICKHCQWPSSKGHEPGSSCAPRKTDTRDVEEYPF